MSHNQLHGRQKWAANRPGAGFAVSGQFSAVSFFILNTRKFFFIS
jgi:hypothetical protein